MNLPTDPEKDDRKVSSPRSENTSNIAVIQEEEDSKKKSIYPTTDFGFIPIPKRLRYNPDKEFEFTILLNAIFGIASTFTVANLYYCQPLLINLANSFNVSYERVSRIPTLVQAGYATGLLLITPLGDLVRRRQLILILVTTGTLFTVGLAVTSDVTAFEALSYLLGVATVTPQVLMPLAADLAPPHRRASAISVVLTGLLFGILIARVLAGVIGNFTSWRVVYYFAIGMQCLILAGSYLLIPDYQSKNNGLNYFHILFSMAKYATTEPTVIQTALVNIASSACFTNFWVTLTFLLGGPPYHYSTLVIGLFGLVGMMGVAVGPFVGHAIDKLVPWWSALVATFAMILGQAIQTGAGGIDIGAVIVTCFILDVFRQTQQVSLTVTVLAIDPNARARLNAICVLSLFIGQVMGTSVGSEVFLRYGWRAGSGLSLALYGFQLFVILLRGPHCPRRTWLGYSGGISASKQALMAREQRAGEENFDGAAQESVRAVIEERRDEPSDSGHKDVKIDTENDASSKI